MTLSLFRLSLSQKFGLLLLFLAVGFKIYYKLRAGMCRSKKKMHGKTVIVTGANSGIGKEAARDLARRGARVILACRNHERGLIAREDIVSSTGNPDVEVRILDVQSLSSVREFAEKIIQTEQRIDVLIHNAGVSYSMKTLNQDNLEKTMATNHFGPFLLTHLLIDLLKKCAPSRVVVVSSVLHTKAKLNLKNLNSEKFFLPNVGTYSHSKLVNILFCNELARRLEGTGVTCNSVHPGAVDTQIWTHLPTIWSALFQTLAFLFFKTATEGAQTLIHLAVSDEVEGVTGKYFEDCKDVKPSLEAQDMELAKKLWEVTEKYVPLRPEDRRI